MASNKRSTPDIADRQPAGPEPGIHLDALYALMAQGVVYHDANGAIILANPAAEEILGLSVAEMTGRQPIDPRWRAIREDGTPFLGEDHPAQVALRTGKPVKDVLMGIHHPQREEYRWILVSAMPEFHEQAKAPYQVFATFTDITARRSAETALSHSEASLKKSQAIAHVGHWTWNTQTNQLSWSDEMYRIFGVDPATFTGALDDVIAQAIHPEDRAKVAQANAEVIDGSGPAPLEYRVLWPDQSVHTLWAQPDEQTTDENGIVLRLSGIVQDITERKKTEYQARAFARLYAILSQVNQAIVRIRDRQALFESICDVAIQYGEFRLAWIGLYDHATGDLAPVAERGYGQNRLPFQEINAHQAPFNTGLIGLALASGTVQYSNDIATDPRMTHWRAPVAGEIFHAAAVIPLYQNEQIVGLLNLYAADIDFFLVQTEQQLLDEIGSDISYALDAMHLEAERARTEEALRSEQQKLASVAASAPGLIYSLRQRPDGTFCMPYASPSIKDVFGVDAEAVITDATPIFGRIHPDDIGASLARIAHSAHTISAWHGEFRYNHPTKGLIWVEGRSMPVADPDGGITWHGFTSDITERKLAEVALRHSEERHRMLVDHMLEGLAYCQLIVEDGEPTDWRYLAVNSAFEPLTGLKDAAGKRATEVIPGIRERDPALLERCARVALTGNPDRFEMFVEALQIWFYISVYSQENGYFVAMFDVITERKQAELALRASEEKYRGLVESLDSVVAVVDGEGRFLYMNEVAAQQLGDPSQHYIGKRMTELFPEPVALNQLRDVRQVIDKDMPMVLENPSIVQGQQRWYRTSIQPLHNEAGRAVNALLTSTDITQIKRAQQELEELNATLEQRVRERTVQIQDLYDNAPVGYHSLDVRGDFVMVNQTELDWLGYTRDEMLTHRNFRELLTPEGQVKFEYHFPRFKEDGVIREIEFELIRKDGTSFHVAINSVAVFDANGAYASSRSTMSDITERKYVETELRLRQEELSAANAALAKAAKLKDEFLASMSHELRTPLTGILGLSEALQTEVYGALNAKQLRTIHSIEESGRHLLNLINDILDLSKIEAGKLELEPSLFSVDEICQASLRLIKQMAATKGQSVTYALDPAGLAMRADPRRLKQTLVNLLSNAVKFTPDGGRLGLDVRCDRERKVVFFSVWDNGIGIAPEDAEKLFKPFVQIDSGLSRSQTGTGLGLSLVHRLAKMHGGSVTLESSLGEGSRFTVALPWVTEATVADTLAAAMASIPVAIDSALLVDDSPDTAELITGYLRELGIKQIIVHTRAEGAAERALTAQPAAIFLDILLPDGSGWDLLRRLKADPQTRDIPVIVVSVIDDRPRAMRLGAADHLLKPVSRSDLQLSLERSQRSHAHQVIEPVLMIVHKSATHKLLLAEDHEVNRQLLQDFLATKGFQVLTATNGHEAIKMVQAERPSLVLMDIQMPVMDGLQAIRLIRGMSDQEVARVPIIALTALAMPGDRERCLTAGANAYLSKPVDLAELSNLIRRLLEEQR